MQTSNTRPITNRYARILAFLPVLLLSSFSTQTQANHQSPKIMDFYPKCNYQILDRVSANSIVPNKDKRLANALDKPTQKIFHQLREKATAIQADGIILTQRQYKQIGTETDADRLVSRLSYHAELIKQCDDTQTQTQTQTETENKPTPYNHLGQQVIGHRTAKVQLRPITFTLPEKTRLNHPSLSNHEVSLDKGVYGVNLGMSYQQVIDIWGSASVELAVLDNELVIGFGRRHWLHFQNDKLMRVSNISLLGVDAQNLVPMRSHFDNGQWKINRKIAIHTSLSDVRATLNTNSPLSKDDRLLLSKNDQTLTLQFALRKSMTGDKSHDLVGFTLQSTHYQSQPWLERNNHQALLLALKQTYQQLKDQQDIELDVLRQQLGEPVGRIVLSPRKTIEIYGSHLLLSTTGQQVSAIHLLEQTFALASQSQTTPWQLGEIKQGQGFAEVKAQLPEGAFGMDDEIQYDGDNYQLKLFFDQKNSTRHVYGAEIKLY